MLENIRKNSVLKVLQTFCSYRERCSFEVQQKLRRMGIVNPYREKLINELKEEGFIDDKRFAETYARGKLINNNWGKVKTRFSLQHLKIPEEYINKAFESIEEDDYNNILQKIIENKCAEITEPNIEIKKNKIARYCIQKGFEPSLIWQMINKTL